MRHLAFYYAIGFAVAGCVMLLAYLSTFVSMVFNNYDGYVTSVLATAMLLPFMIATLSWREWREAQKNNNSEGGRQYGDAGTLEG